MKNNVSDIEIGIGRVGKAGSKVRVPPTFEW